jgi:UDP-N-acetylglucosamine 2-epimerase (non-hydrolysing)
MCHFESVVPERKPDLAFVYGDVNSTVAAALVCSKLMVRLAHGEVGLRSFDRSMPEKINRLVTDQLSDLLFTPSEDGNLNLAHEGIAQGKVFLAGNVMIDTLVRMLPEADRSLPADLPSRYALVTLHLPSNVDNLDWLGSLLSSLGRIGHGLEVIFPVHPRTRQKIASLGIGLENGSHMRFLEPLPYLEFLGLQKHAAVVITDSGGIQEETTFLGVPCLTVRENTERPVPITIGTNVLVGRGTAHLSDELARIPSEPRKNTKVQPLWDGHAAERIAKVIFDQQVD